MSPQRQPKHPVMTEKRTPSYNLDEVKSAFSTAGDLNATKTALDGAWKMGLRQEGIVEVIQSIQRQHFWKSMTSYRNHRVWQDVYYVPWTEGTIYVKFTVDALTEFLLLSFKEK